jgi:signal recognition particle receptor subunit beta
VAANKQDDPTSLPVAYVRRRLGLPFEVPVVPCVASDRASVRLVLLGLLKHIAAKQETI